MSVLQKTAVIAWIAAVVILLVLATTTIGLYPQGPEAWDSGWVHFRYSMTGSLGYVLTLAMFLGGGSALIFGWERLE